MDENTRNQDKSADPAEPESRSAFPRREAAHQPSQDPEEKPIPSQPRSFSPVRPQRNAVPRKPLTTPAPNPAAPTSESRPEGVNPEAPVPVDSAPTEPSRTAVTGSPDNLNSAPGGKPSPPRLAGSFKARTAADYKSPAGPARPATSPAAVSQTKSPDTVETVTPTGTTGGTVATGSATPSSGGATTPPAHLGSGAGGDTIRLRVTPRPVARTLNTAPGRGVRRRLPDIRQGKAATSSSGHYGPFSLMFGFLWLIFKMIFFTGLVLGLGALIGFMVMTEYIKTPEVTVPNVSGMKIEEAFTVLSDKNLGVIKRRVESSGLVAPGEIISQQPPAGASAKVDTDVGVVISSGRSQFVVPSVVNETKENAINKVKGARLEVGNMLTLEDSSVPRGNVISQTPIGGTGSDEAVKVDLMISAGPPGKSLTMPDLAGRSVLEAKAALKAVGIEDVVTDPEDAAPDAIVVSHSPLVGKTVFQTDKINLTTKKK